MRKISLMLFLAGVIALSASTTKAQEQPTQPVNQKIIKALETRITELEAKRAAESKSDAAPVIDKLLVDLRAQVASLKGETAVQSLIKSYEARIAEVEALKATSAIAALLVDFRKALVNLKDINTRQMLIKTYEERIAEIEGIKTPAAEGVLKRLREALAALKDNQ